MLNRINKFFTALFTPYSQADRARDNERAWALSHSKLPESINVLMGELRKLNTVEEELHKDKYINTQQRKEQYKRSYKLLEEYKKHVNLVIDGVDNEEFPYINISPKSLYVYESHRISIYFHQDYIHLKRYIAMSLFEPSIDNTYNKEDDFLREFPIIFAKFIKDTRTS